MENQDPLIILVNNMILQAVKQKASDIHIEPYINHYRVRYRQCGILYEMTEIPRTLSERFITRLKVLAKLDISERRLPQDGRFNLAQTDVRINTCPTLLGEKIVLRLLNSHPVSLNIHTLGFTENQKNLFTKTLTKPQGMILVAGPTGCGKTVTLYSGLQLLNTSERNISTVEDPVEIHLPGINQVNVQPKIGLTFSSVLKTFLRQDPDVIMVGEIRDVETATIAIQAAQTGHLVLSTLHANSAKEAFTRLLSMGISEYHLRHSLSLVIAQRLIRSLCVHCKQPETITHDKLAPFYRAKGCEQCLQGYEGRIGIYETLLLSSQEDYIPLREAGFALVTQGLTSLEEFHRVMGHE